MRKAPWLTAAVLVLPLLAGGCADLCRTRGWTWSSPPPNDRSFDWLAEYQRLRSVPPEVLSAERENREAAFASQPSPDHRVRLALLLASAPQPIGDADRATELLSEMPEQAADDPVGEVAQHLLEALRERSQQRGELARAQKQATALRQELSTAQERIKVLEEQLKAFTSIEQNIQERIQSEEPGTP